MRRDYSVNRRLDRLLRERRVSSWELALRSGIGVRRLNRVLCLEEPLYPEELPSLARALGVTVDSLLDLEYTGEKGKE